VREFNKPITKETKLYNRCEAVLRDIKGTAVDIGCGRGEVLVKAKLLGHDIIGLDRSEKEIEYAQKLATISGVHVDIDVGSIENLPYNKESFDTVILGEVVEHLPNLYESVGATLELLKPGGTLIITTPAGFAHRDPDHKNFFFTTEQTKLLEKLWVFDLLPTYMLMFNFYDVNVFTQIEGFTTNVSLVEHGDSKRPSFDFYITITRDK
jgi:2-polyprenyl-3-methyl-5-hydroxy-6-metoxy-1,4-benzoquinol methylase